MLQKNIAHSWHHGRRRSHARHGQTGLWVWAGRGYCNCKHRSQGRQRGLCLSKVKTKTKHAPNTALPAPHKPAQLSPVTVTQGSEWGQPGAQGLRSGVCALHCASPAPAGRQTGPVGWGRASAETRALWGTSSSSYSRNTRWRGFLIGEDGCKAGQRRAWAAGSGGATSKWDRVPPHPTPPSQAVAQLRPLSGWTPWSSCWTGTA